MLAKKIIRFCAVMVLSGLSSVAVSNTLYWEEALQLVDQNGVATIPESFTRIGSEAFRGSNVKVVNLPSSLTNIESGAFKYTSQLEHITIPDSVTSISDYAFQYSAIKTIDLPDSPLSIGQYAFENSQLGHIRLSSGSTIGQRAFQNTPLKSLWIGENVNFGGNAAIFHNSHSKLKTIVSYTDFDGYQGVIESYYTVPGQCCNTTQIKGIFGLGFSSIPGNLDYFILRNAEINNSVKTGSNSYQPEDFSSNDTATVIIEGAVNFGHSTSFLSAILIKPYQSSVRHNLPESSSISFCDPIDSDGDSYYDCYDQFPNDPDRWFDYGESSDADPGEADLSSSGLIHSDSDGLADIFDTYPTTNNVEGFGENRDQSEYELDTDYDGINNHNDIDDDDDGLLDIYEPFFGTNPLIPDSDFDGTLDGLDAFPLDNTESLDTDTDGIGNNADTDDDNDGHFDLLDAFPLDSNEWMDSDLDGVGNNADTDDDNDGVLDDEDAFPYTASDSVDTDGDGVGDNSDAFPNDSSETLDTDLDGIGNNADTDDDNDGVADAEDSDPLNDSIGALESQNIFVMGNPVAVNGYLATISVGYDVSDDNNQLNGIGFRVHYDSSIFNYSAVQNTLNDSVVVDGMGTYQDVEDFDNDSTTDSYLVYGWAAISGDWPNVALPAKLTDIQMFVNWADYEAGSTTSNINFSVVSNNEGYEAKATDYAMTVLPATWDFDGNGSADALTDGLMLLRYTFGIQGLDMTTDAISADATLSPTQIVDNMHRALSVADIDGNSTTDALTDGLLLLRYMFGLNGDALVDSAVSSEATRTSAEAIEEYIALYMPNELSLPVQSEQNFMVGDWKLASPPKYAYTDEIINGTPDWHGYLNIYGNEDELFSLCMADDLYKFDQNGTFSYFHGEATYASEGITIFGLDSGCSVMRSPWDGSFDMDYVVNEDESTIKVLGKGAYIGLAQVANGINEIPEPYFAPDEVIYNYTKISDDEIQLDILGGHYGYRYRLQRIFGN